MTQEQAILEWFATGERGLSSETIARHLTGMPHTGRKSFNGAWTPSDPADLRRCMLLIESLPDPIGAVQECRNISDKWAILVDNWDDLISNLKREMAAGDMAPDTFKMMRELLP